MELPLGVVAIAVSAIILEAVSEFAQNDVNASHQTQSWAIWVVLVLGLPCAAVLAVFGELILSTLFQYGEMTVSDIEAAALSLVAYSAGLPAFMMIKVLALFRTPGFEDASENRFDCNDLEHGFQSDACVVVRPCGLNAHPLCLVERGAVTPWSAPARLV